MRMLGCTHRIILMCLLAALLSRLDGLGELQGSVRSFREVTKSLFLSALRRGNSSRVIVQSKRA